MQVIKLVELCDDGDEVDQYIIADRIARFRPWNTKDESKGTILYLRKDPCLNWIHVKETPDELLKKLLGGRWRMRLC